MQAKGIEKCGWVINKDDLNFFPKNHNYRSDKKISNIYTRRTSCEIEVNLFC